MRRRRSHKDTAGFCVARHFGRGHDRPATTPSTYVPATHVTEEEAADLVSAVDDYAVPFMDSTTGLAGLCQRLDERMGFDRQLVYRRRWPSFSLATWIERAS